MPAEVNAVKAIFTAALEKIEPGERAAYVAEACGKDDELRQRVEILLKAHDDPGSFMKLPVAGPADALAGTIGEPITEGPGTVIGSYKLREEIGEGGFGVVFMAEQKEPIRRKVALKVLKPGMDTREVIARFEAERQALALMDHPNIAKVLDAGQTSSGRPFFVMELVKGIPITRFCDESQLPLKERLELFVNVCKAVQHAHQKGIIHRDIKPSNVLVTMQDGAPVVRVIDFGIAKAIGQQLTDKTFFTGFAQMVGTPLYMSPEQAALSNVDVDTRSDVYSLGVLLYELLTGTTPIDRKRLREAAYDEVRRIIREEEPLKPSTRISTLGQAVSVASAQRKSDPKRLSQTFRGELDWIVMKALDKDRDRRYGTATGLAEDLGRYLTNEPVTAGPPTAMYRLRKFVRRHRAALLATLLIALSITALVAAIGWGILDRATRRGDIARQVGASLLAVRTLLEASQPDVARQKLAEAKVLIASDRDSLPTLAAEVDTFEAELNRLRRFMDLVDNAHQSEGRAGSTTPAPWDEMLLQALALYRVPKKHDWWAPLEHGVLGKQLVEKLRRTVYEELLWLANDIAPVVFNLRYGAVLLADREGRIIGRGAKLTPQQRAQKALAYLAAAEKTYPPSVSLYKLRAKSHQVQGNEKAAKADRELAETTPPTMAIDYFMRGMDLNSKALSSKDTAAAAEAFEAGLRLDPTHYRGMMMLGDCLMNFRQGLINDPSDMDKTREALWIYSHCIFLRPRYGQAYDHRARAHWLLGRFSEAVNDYGKAIELNPRDSFSWYGRSLCYENLEQWDKALADISKTLELGYDKRSDRARLYKKAGKWDEALAEYTALIDADSLNRAFRLVDRGMLYYAERGQWDKALGDFSAAVELDCTILEPWMKRALAYAHLGEKDKALDDFSHALVLEKTYVLYTLNLSPFADPQLGLWEGIIAVLSKRMALQPTDADYPNALAYLLATHPDIRLRDPRRAVELAKKAVALAPESDDLGLSLYRGTLGIAYYSAAEWLAALGALEASRGHGNHWPACTFFLSMTHSQLGHKDQARELYGQGNKQMSGDANNAELRRLRSQAAKLLGVKE